MSLLRFAWSRGVLAQCSLFLFFIAVTVCSSCSQGAGERIQLSIQGEEAGKKQEFSSLSAALEAARAYPLDCRKTLAMGSGKYFLSAPIVLDERDRNLVIEAEPQADVKIFGGRQITGWKPAGKFWVADAPGTKDRSWDFRMLLVNSRYAPRARYPAEGRLQHQSVFAPLWLSTSAGGWERKPTTVELTTMKYDPKDLDSELNPENAEITVFHMWDETLAGVKSIDTNTHVITFSGPTGHPPGGFGIQDYVVWNDLCGMTTPGQWYLDRSNEKVVYWPLPDEKLSALDVVAPTMETLIHINGSSNITLRGLTLAAANTPLKAGGFGAKKFDGAVSVKNGSDCRFEDLEITGVAGWGLNLFGNGLKVKGCRIHHVGAGGINLFDVGSSGAMLEGNEIHHIGLTYPSAIALCVGSTDPNDKEEWALNKKSFGVTIRNNEIHDTPYTGISCGGAGHVIDGNLVYRVMQVLGDGSGIYVTFCRGLVLRNNLVRDIKEAPHSGSSAYYLDEQTDDTLIENNVSLGVARPVLCHMSKNNTFRNNIFIVTGPGRIFLPRCKDLRFEKNIMVADGEISIVNFDAISSFENNILFSKTNSVLAVMQDPATYAESGSAPMDESGTSRFDDPGVLSWKNGKIIFKPDSLAEKTGIKPVDGSEAGVHGSRTL